MSPEIKVFSSSLYPRMKVEIDGVVLMIGTVNKAVFDVTESMFKLQEKDQIKIAGMIYEQVAMILEAPEPAPGEPEVDVRQFIYSRKFQLVRDLMKYINQVAVIGEIPEETKKESGPGETPTP